MWSARVWRGGVSISPMEAKPLQPQQENHALIGGECNTPRRSEASWEIRRTKSWLATLLHWLASSDLDGNRPKNNWSLFLIRGLHFYRKPIVEVFSPCFTAIVDTSLISTWELPNVRKHQNVLSFGLKLINTIMKQCVCVTLSACEWPRAR